MSNKFIIVNYLLIILLLIITAIDPFLAYSQENGNDNDPLNTFRDFFNTFKKNVFNLYLRDCNIFILGSVLLLIF